MVWQGLRIALLSGALALVACGEEETGEDLELTFQGEQKFLGGFSYDSGYQPSASPIAVKLALSSGGAIKGSARGRAVENALVGTPGSGAFSLGGQVMLKASLKISFAGSGFEGPIPNAPSIELKFGGSTSFDPFLLGSKASLKVKVPEAQLAKIPLAGALSTIPGVKGDLIIYASGDLSSELQGICATIKDGVAQYTARTTTSGTLKIKPVVDITIPLLGSKKLDSLTIQVPIPAISAAMDLGSLNVADGTASTAKPCAGTGGDGGVDGSGPTDGPKTSPDGLPGTEASPGKDKGACTAESDCVHLNVFSTAKGICQSGLCVMACLGDYYDVNGLTSDGCEHLDAMAANSSETTAYKMQGVSDCDGTQTIQVPVPSDSRYHVKAPADRRWGTEKWVKISITDNVVCNLSAKVTFDLTKLPAGNSYNIEAKYKCTDGTTGSKTGQSLAGGKTATLDPNIPCGFNDGGTLYMRIYKGSGLIHSSAPAVISIEP